MWSCSARVPSAKHLCIPNHQTISSLGNFIGCSSIYVSYSHNVKYYRLLDYKFHDIKSYVLYFAPFVSRLNAVAVHWLNWFPLQHPGNIAVDDANGGRLIFYDFGMMGRLLMIILFSPKSIYVINLIFILFTRSISPNIREGLLEVFYGVYEKDPDKVSFSW